MHKKISTKAHQNFRQWLLSIRKRSGPGIARRRRNSRIPFLPQESQIQLLEARALLAADFGDAPAPYPTAVAQDGASHITGGNLKLGSAVDSEVDGVGSAAADADGVDDDGVAFATIRVGTSASVSVNVSGAPAGAKLDAWIDFNRDGVWGGPGEQIMIARQVANGVNSFEFLVPGNGVSGTTFARFRLSSTGGLGVTGEAVDGEVEDYQLSILPPLPGSGDFVEQTPFDAFGPDNVTIADIDGDGDPDALYAELSNNQITWLENQGDLSFATHTLNEEGVINAFPSDVDGDGDVDIVSVSYDLDRVSWYQNNGAQNFSRQTISNTADGASDVIAVDVDGDGDTDVLSASTQDDKVAWYENDGGQNFTTHTISSSADVAQSIFAADIDGDGDMDVLSASSRDDKIAWYENDGSESFTVRIISTSADDAQYVIAADINGDGHMDVLSASRGDNKIAWYENDGNSNFSTHVISTSATNVQGITAADPDGDGDLDVVGGQPGSWYENTGAGVFVFHEVANVGRASVGISFSDMDGDGDLDKFHAHADGVILFKNESAGVLANPGTANFTGATPNVLVAPGIVVADVDSRTLETAKIQITNFIQGQDELTFSNDGLTMGNIDIATNSDGVLTLVSNNATATLAQWQAAIRSVAYRNSSQNPNTETRSIEILVNDTYVDSNTITSVVAIINDAPTSVTLSPTTVSLAEDTNTASATVLSSITVTDDLLGVNTLSLAGPDASRFEIVAGKLRLRAGTALNFEAKTSYSVIVNVNDASVGGPVDASAAFTLTILNALDTTPAADAFVFAYSSSSVTVTHSMNGGAPITIGTFPLTSARILSGLTAQDSVRVVGTSAADLIAVTSTGLSINGAALILSGTASKTLAGSAGSDTYQFDTDSPLGIFTLEDSSGTDDTISFAPTTGLAVTLNLSAAAVQDINSHLSLQLLTPAAFENVFGGAGDDVLLGNSSDNLLTGNSGHDHLNGRGGDDEMTGGQGDDSYHFSPAAFAESDVIRELSDQGLDTLLFSTIATDISLSLLTSQARLIHANRTLRMIGSSFLENVIGGSGDDILEGNGGPNLLRGNAGNDRLKGGKGDDQLLGGQGDDVYTFGMASDQEFDTVAESVDAGVDTLSLTTITNDIELKLNTTLVQAIHTHRSLQLIGASGIEVIRSGSGNDSLDGNNQDNVLDGGDGDDRLTGSGGDDLLLGGPGSDRYAFISAPAEEADAILERTEEGSDTLDFSELRTAVTINMGSSALTPIHANRTLRLIGASAIESVIGGHASDIVLGNSLDNVLIGNSGNDVLVGNSGNDHLLGEDGRDILIGGYGLDQIEGGSGDDILIAGRSSSDSMPTRLHELRTEWSSGKSYAARLASLRAGVGPSGASLKAAVNVRTDLGEDDQLTGNGELDWYLKAVDDVVSDLFSGEVLNAI